MDFNKYTTLVQAMIVGMAVYMSGKGIYVNSVLSAQSFCEPKTALKKSIFKKLNFIGTGSLTKT